MKETDLKSMLTSVCNCLEEGLATAGLCDCRVNGQAKQRRERGGIRTLEGVYKATDENEGFKGMDGFNTGQSQL